MKIIYANNYSTADYLPDSFDFIDQSNIALSSTIISNYATVTGINQPVSVTATGCEVEINNSGSWVSNGMVSENQQIRVRLTSSSSYSTSVCGNIVVGELSPVDFCVTTEAQPVPSLALDTVSGNGSDQFGLSGWSAMRYNTNGVLADSRVWCSQVTIPRDGNWYYWEGKIISAHASGTTDYVGMWNGSSGTYYALSSTRGFAVRSTSGTTNWERAHVSNAGAVTNGGSFTASVVYPSVSTTASKTIGILLGYRNPDPYGSQLAIFSISGATVYRLDSIYPITY